MPFPATIKVPQFGLLHHAELKALVSDFRNGLMLQVFLILVCESDFVTGKIETSYARLQELCSPPNPEKGGRKKGPSYDQMRYAMELLEGCKLVRRDRSANAAQGILRLRIKPRKNITAQSHA